MPMARIYCTKSLAGKVLIPSEASALSIDCHEFHMRRRNQRMPPGVAGCFPKHKNYFDRCFNSISYYCNWCLVKLLLKSLVRTYYVSVTNNRSWKHLRGFGQFSGYDVQCPCQEANEKPHWLQLLPSLSLTIFHLLGITHSVLIFSIFLVPEHSDLDALNILIIREQTCSLVSGPVSKFILLLTAA